MRWLFLLLMTGPAAAQDASYFTGPYERIGRGAGGVPIDDRVRLDPAPDSTGLILTACTPGEVWRLDPDPDAEVPNLLTGQAPGGQVDCQVFNDWSNYPLLACHAEDGGRFTLWASPGEGC